MDLVVLGHFLLRRFGTGASNLRINDRVDARNNLKEKALSGKPASFVILPSVLSNLKKFVRSVWFGRSRSYVQRLPRESKHLRRHNGQTVRSLWTARHPESQARSGLVASFIYHPSNPCFSFLISLQCRPRRRKHALPEQRHLKQSCRIVSSRETSSKAWS